VGGTILAAVAVFAGTNIDDLVVLTLLFLGWRASGAPRPGRIVAGQYLGIAVLVAVSALIALGLAAAPDRWIGLLGLVPLGLGVAGLVRTARTRKLPREAGETAPPVVASGLLAVAGLTIANGADNISVYAPTFSTIGIARSVVMIAVFAVLVGVACAAGAALGSHRRVVAAVRRVGHWLVPLVFVALGLVIIGSGALR